MIGLIHSHGGLQSWIKRLNSLPFSQRAHELREREAECSLLGHDPSGEQLMTWPPTDICYWCLTRYRDERTDRS